jgi:hypothetical protein
MAIYTTLFLCTHAELPGGFPGWKMPLEQAVRREVRNPFTGQTIVVESNEPDWPEETGDAAPQDYQVVAIKGDYQDYLEGRLPPFVRSCLHWATKGLTELELGPLLAVVGIEESLQHAIYCRPSQGTTVQQFPRTFFPQLQSLDLNDVAKNWAAAMSTREHTHNVSGVKLNDGWRASDAHGILHEMATLALKATNGQRLYLLVEA